MGFIFTVSDIAVMAAKLGQSFVLAHGINAADPLNNNNNDTSSPSTTLVQMHPDDDGYTGDLIADSFAAMPLELRAHFEIMAYRTRHEVCEIAKEAIIMLKGLELGTLEFKIIKEEIGVVVLENPQQKDQVFDVTGAHLHAMTQYEGHKDFTEKLQQYLSDEAMATLGASAIAASTSLFLESLGGNFETTLPTIPIIGPCFGG
jgi:hypothetical protein